MASCFFGDVHSSCYVNFTSTSHTAVNPDPNVCINVGVRGRLYRANASNFPFFNSLKMYTFSYTTHSVHSDYPIYCYCKVVCNQKQVMMVKKTVLHQGFSPVKHIQYFSYT